MLDVPYIRTLYAYERWANERMLATVARLTGEQFLKPMGSSHTSVRDTAVHILSSQLVWLGRWKGASPAMLDPSPYADVGAVRAAWREMEAEQQQFIAALTTERLQAPVTYRNFQGESFSVPLWQQMVHVVNHASYHRGQITTMLRQLGALPVATDMIVYFRENPQP